MTQTLEGEVDTQARAAIEKVKIVALTTGVRIAPDVLAELGGPDELTIHEYATTGGVTLELPEGVLVNAPFDEPFCERTPLRLERTAGELELALDDIRVPVHDVLPLPGFLDATDEAGRPVRDTVMSHADRIRVSPIVGCAYNCRFCDLGTLRYERRPLEQILQAIDVALVDRALPPRHLLISGGTSGAPPEHQQYFEDVCVGIVRHVLERRPDFEVDIMMSPRKNAATFVDALVDAGISGFSLNIELFSEESAKVHLPLKHAHSRPHLEEAISRAVERLGSSEGRVRSLIIPGLEPPDETIAGVDWLASLGCHPVLSPFRPARHTPLADEPPMSPDVLETVLVESRKVVRTRDVELGPRCAPCQHNTLSFPWDLPVALAA
jgi:Radical SAM superfamily